MAHSCRPASALESVGPRRCQRPALPSGSCSRALAPCPVERPSGQHQGGLATCAFSRCSGDGTFTTSQRSKSRHRAFGVLPGMSPRSSAARKGHRSRAAAVMAAPVSERRVSALAASRRRCIASATNCVERPQVTAQVVLQARGVVVGPSGAVRASSDDASRELGCRRSSRAVAFCREARGCARRSERIALDVLRPERIVADRHVRHRPSRSCCPALCPAGGMPSRGGVGAGWFAVCRCRCRISPRISRAASGMLVPGPKIALTPGLLQEAVVLLRDHAAADHQDVARALRLQRLDQLRRQRLVPRRLATRCRPRARRCRSRPAPPPPASGTAARRRRRSRCRRRPWRSPWRRGRARPGPSSPPASAAAAPPPRRTLSTSAWIAAKPASPS